MSVLRAEALVVAPAAFGALSEEFVERAVAEVPGDRAVGAVVSDSAPLERAFDGAGRPPLVLGSLGSDLAAEVAMLADSRDVVHLEVGSLSDLALGRNSLMVTAGAHETALSACDALGGRAYRLATEVSPFADALVPAVAEVNPASPPPVPIERLLEDFGAFWRDGAATDALLTIARPPYPEQLCAAIGESGIGGVEMLGIGAFGRPDVDAAARRARVVLRFVDPLPANLLDPEMLVPAVRDSLLAYLPARRTLYGDLGWAAGRLLRTIFEAGHPVTSDGLAHVTLSASEVGFGHGVAFDGAGHNTLATKALLAWEDGAVVLASGAAQREQP